jgi:hypothetical protein
MATTRRVRKNKSAFSTDEHDILNGRAKIFRTDASGDFWQLRMWVAAEAKYVRKTLKTKDLDTAVVRAECKIAPNNDPTFYSVQHIAAIA